MTRHPQPPRPTDRDDDPTLGDLFAALRQEDRQALPRFDRLICEARIDSWRAAGTARGGRWLWVEAGVFAAVVVAVLVQVLPSRAPGPDSLEDALVLARAIDAWEAPTDAVLEIALLKMPDTVPTLEFTSVP